MAVQGTNIEMLPPEGKIKFLGQLITFTNAVQVEFEHRIKCAWATFTSHRQELTSPRHPLRDRLKLDATRLRHVDDVGRNEEEPPGNATSDDEDDHTNKETSR